MHTYFRLLFFIKQPWEANNQREEMLAAPQLQPTVGPSVQYNDDISQPGSDYLVKVPNLVGSDMSSSGVTYEV